jgi:hypothetical protein
MTAGKNARFLSALVVAAALLPGAAWAADEIHWTFTGPTSVSFDWRGAETTVRYGLTTAYGQTATAVTPSPLPFSSSGPFKEARITGLAVNTVYHYSIGTGPDHTFRTPLAPGSSGFTVYAQGDIGDSASWWRVGWVQSAIAAARPDFVLCVGDLTYGNSVGQQAVDNHFNDVMKWSLDAAYMPAWGNHEFDTSADDLRNYKGRFDLPNPQATPGAPAAGCCGEDWWWWDYGNVRFIVYPEYYGSGAWPDWDTRVRPIMAAAQSNPAITFIVTVGHQPAYSSSGIHPGESDLAAILDDLGATYSKYVLNVNAHSHNYERSRPQSGVVHLTVGTGGSDMYRASSGCAWQTCPGPSWSAFRAMHHGTVKLRFEAASIQGTVVCGPADPGNDDITCVQGTVMDSFVIGSQPLADTVPPGAVRNLLAR